MGRSILDRLRDEGIRRRPEQVQRDQRTPPSTFTPDDAVDGQNNRDFARIPRSPEQVQRDAALGGATRVRGAAGDVSSAVGNARIPEGFFPNTRARFNALGDSSAQTFQDDGFAPALGEMVRQGLALPGAFASDVVDSVDVATEPPARFLEQLVTGSVSPRTSRRAPSAVGSGQTSPTRDVSGLSAADLLVTPLNGLVGTSGEGFGRTLGLAGRDPATGIGPNSNFIQGEPGDAAFAADQFRRANEIRQSIIDSQNPDLVPGFERIVTLGDGQPTGAEAAQQQVADLFERARRERDPGAASALLRQALGAQSNLGDIRNVESRALSDQIDAQSAIQQALIGSEGLGEARRARAARDRAVIEGIGQPDPVAQPTVDELGTLITDLRAAGVPEDDPRMQQLLQRVFALTGQFDLEGSSDEELDQLLSTVGLAEGGIVPPGPGTGSAIGGTLGATTPQLPDLASMQQFQQYVEGVRRLGLEPVSFEEFAQLQRGAGALSGAADAPQPSDVRSVPGAVSLADGGQVPDASGKMVTDTNPSAPVDSIPAVIDGQRPAQLDSGEFVLPRDVVLHFGTDKLNKMIQQAREAVSGNG